MAISAKKVVYFQVRAGKSIGMGHLARCLALAECFARRGWSNHFFVNDNEHAIRKIRNADRLYQCSALDNNYFNDTNWMCEQIGTGNLFVTDLRGISIEHYRCFRDNGIFVVSLDDIGEPLPSNVIVNGAIAERFKQYDEPVPPQTYLLGADYIPLRSEFALQAPDVLDANRTHLLVTFGGSDPEGYTMRAMAAIEMLPTTTVNLILGPSYDDAELALDLAAGSKHYYRVHNPVHDFRAIMSVAKLALSAGGITLYEMLSQNVPVLVVPASEREAGEIEILGEMGAVSPLHPELFDFPEQLAPQILEYWENSGARSNLVDSARGLVEGNGAERVTETVIRLFIVGQKSSNYRKY